MNEVVELLDNYAAASKTFVASAFILNNCCEGKDEESKLLKQLKSLYVTSMVRCLCFEINYLTY